MMTGILLVMAWAAVWCCVPLEGKPHIKIDEMGDDL